MDFPKYLPPAVRDQARVVLRHCDGALADAEKTLAKIERQIQEATRQIKQSPAAEVPECWRDDLTALCR